MQLRIQAEPMRQSKSGKFYQTAKSVELVDGAAVVIPTVKPAAVKDVSSQWKEKYRLTMSNLLASYLSNRHGNDIDEDKAFTLCDKLVRQILDAKYDGDEAPF